MAIKVIMPQMGEAILEGTVTKWLKKIGDRVRQEESLFEVSTDKVDTEIPSPSEGILTQILVKEGETVQVNTVVAVLEATAESAGEIGTAAPAAAPREMPEENQVQSISTDVRAADSGAAVTPEPMADEEAGEIPGAGAPAMAAADSEVAAPVAPAKTDEVGNAAPAASPATILTEGEAPISATPSKSGAPAEIPAPEPLFVRTSPLVRRIARDHGVDLSKVRGTGLSGRITKEDLLPHLEGATRAAASPPKVTEQAVKPAQAPAAPPASSTTMRKEFTAAHSPAPDAGESVVKPAATASTPAAPMGIPGLPEDSEIVTMSPMRKAIADHMVQSKRTSAHVQTVFEVDMTAVLKLREKHADEFEARTGISLTYTPFFVKALVETVRDFPILNSSVSGDKIIMKKAINVGIAVALDTGLIVPVIMNAHLKSFPELALAIHDLARRARTKRLKPEEVRQGTITVTNPGIFGSLFGMPIINQPQVGILCVGSLEKRPVVINDAIAIRTMSYLVLSFDHRIIDGAVADQAMGALKTRLQSWNAWRD